MSAPGRRAYCLIREQPWYRREAFVAGLRAAGLEVTTQLYRRPDPGTVLVIWNRYGDWHARALEVEAGGGTVLVAENGYIGAGGGTPKFQVHPAGPRPDHYYALARGYHNGGGTWPDLGSQRWARLGVEIKPWRRDGDYVLVCPNRSFGVPSRMMHPDWPERTAARLRRVQGLPVRVRPHPGNTEPKRALAEDLDGAAAVVIWNSSCGVHALLAGVPVFVEAGHWILKGAAAGGRVEDSGTWVLPDRLPHLERMASAQWTVEEIASGEPFRHLLSDAGQGKGVVDL